MRKILEERALNEWPNNCGENTDCEGCEYLNEEDLSCKLDNQKEETK